MDKYTNSYLEFNYDLEMKKNMILVMDNLALTYCDFSHIIPDI